MKKLSRTFTLREKILLLVLCLILVGLAYYQFVDRPVRSALETAHAEAESLSTELTAVEAKLAKMRRMRSEMEDITAGGTVSEMGSYNNSKVEIALLNDILAETTQYSISFADVTRNGDQIRRNFTLQFTVDDYSTMDRVIARLANCHYRCLVGDVRCTLTRVSYRWRDNLTVTELPEEWTVVTVNATATFFETMVGGTPDAGLPQTKATS